MTLPIVVFNGRSAVRAVRSATYGQTSDRIQTAATYQDAVMAMERAVSSGERGLALDFAPAADYARRFVNSTGRYLAQPQGSDARALGERGIHAFTRILFGGGRPGRPRGVAPAGSVQAHVRSMADRWAAVLRPIWVAVGTDKSRLVEALVVAPGPSFLWTAAHRRELRALLRRPGLRPSTLVEQLTAWTLQLSVRQVRASRSQPAVVHA